MHFYKKTGCCVFLVGCLKEMPELRMDEDGEFFAVLTIDRQNVVRDANNALHDDEVLSYRVHVLNQSALRIRQFGFVGLHLWIEGDFQNNGEIFAEKISFIEAPESGEINSPMLCNSVRQLQYRENFYLSFIENKSENDMYANNVH